MKDDSQIDEAPEGIESSNEVTERKSARSYAPLRRRLKEEELMNIGSVNLLIDDIERMDDELGELKRIRNQYHQNAIDTAVLKEKLSAYKLGELSYNISISLGALLVGLAKPLWGVEFYGLVALIGGAALWLSGTAMKFGRMFIK